MARNTTSKGTSSRTRKPKSASDDTAPQATEATPDKITPTPTTAPDAAPDAGVTTAAEMPAPDAPVPATPAPDTQSADATPAERAAPAQPDPAQHDSAQSEPAHPESDQTQTAQGPADAPVSGADPAAEGDAAPADTGTGAAPAPDAPAAGPVAGNTQHAQAAASKPAFLPLLLGGVLAGGIGYGAHFLTNDSASVQAELAVLQSEMAQLRSSVGAAPDLAPLEGQVEQLRAALEQMTGTAPETGDLDALRAQLDSLTTQTQTQAEALQQAQDQIAADLAQVRELAENRIASAEAAIDAALAQSGLDSIRAALETGQPFSDATDRIAQGGFAVPDMLAANAATGIPTLEQLQQRFPDAARAAIRASLGAAPAETAGERVVNFLRAQTGARSTVPRQGDDPDAIMSRASAAVEAGDLDLALTLLDDLPDAGRAALSDWHSAATARQAAIGQTDALAQMITKE
ncbi:hypothetical protein [Roseinatronobacter sp. NSM]|uniref:hypothetical protein n=1 Tax=Roseinatronobacter sp. NSM TaxID=3457785 RepID=UPI0040369AEE